MFFLLRKCWDSEVEWQALNGSLGRGDDRDMLLRATKENEVIIITYGTHLNHSASLSICLSLQQIE